MWTKGMLTLCWWEYRSLWSQWNRLWRFLLKKILEIDLPHNLAISLLVVYPQDLDTTSQRVTCTAVFIAALFAIAKIWNQSRGPLPNEGIKEM